MSPNLHSFPAPLVAAFSRKDLEAVRRELEPIKNHPSPAMEGANWATAFASLAVQAESLFPKVFGNHSENKGPTQDAEPQDFLRLALSLGANPHHPGLLLLAIEKDSDAQQASDKKQSAGCLVGALLDAGADPNLVEDYMSPLVLAIRRQNLGVAKLLMSAGADPLLEVGYRKTGFSWAMNEGVDDFVLFLLDSDQDPNTEMRIGTLLTQSIAHGCEKVVAALLSKGAKVSIEDPDFWFDAITLDKAHLLPVLLEYGADIHAKDHHGYTSIHMWVCNFCSCMNEEDRAIAGKVLDLLVERGADINAANKYGETPLDMLLGLHDFQKRSSGVSLIMPLFRAHLEAQALRSASPDINKSVHPRPRL